MGALPEASLSDAPRLTALLVTVFDPSAWADSR